MPGSSRTVDRLPIGEESYRVVAVLADSPGGRFVVLSARSLDPTQDSLKAVSIALATGLPLLLLLVASTTWVVTGRALRPVEGALGTWAGSTVGMVAADALAIVVGGQLGKRLPERAIRIGGGDLVRRLRRRPCRQRCPVDLVGSRWRCPGISRLGDMPNQIVAPTGLMASSVRPCGPGEG